MSAAELDITIEQGANFSRSLIYKINDTPVDLTDYTAKGQIRFSPSAEPVAEFDITFATPRSSGAFSISLTALDTEAIPTGETATAKESIYRYDLVLQKAGVVTRILQGRAYISPAITKD